MNTPILDSVLVFLCVAWLQRAVSRSCVLIQAGYPPGPASPVTAEIGS